MAAVQYAFSPYGYCNGNPIIVVDRDGNIGETVWDVASLVTGVKSFVSNVKQGKVGAAIVDGVGIVADAAAVATPLVPGGVGAGIKAVRAGGKAVDAVKGVERASDAAKAANKAGDVSGTIGKTANKTKRQDDLKNVIYEVPGSSTNDGKPYIGRTNDLSRRRNENRDGRDRTKAKVVDHYDPNVSKAGSIQEQKAINKRGLDNLNNKRNEIKKSDWERYGIK